MMMKKIITLMVVLLLGSVLVSATFGGQYHRADDILWSKTNEEGSFGSFTSNTTYRGSLTYFFPLALSFGGSMFFGSDIYVYGNAKTSTELAGTLGWQKGVTGIFNTGDVNVTVNKGLIIGLSGSDKGSCSNDSQCARATCIEGSAYQAYDLLKGAESCIGGVCVASPLTAVCPYGCTNGHCDGVPGCATTGSFCNGTNNFQHNRFIGVNNQGACMYESVACLHGCDDGNGCLPASCSGETCSPPLNY